MKPILLLAGMALGTGLLTRPLPAQQAPDTPRYVARKAIVTGDRVNVRGQARLMSEVVTQLHTGDSVIVVDEITPENPEAYEPAVWAKVSLPPDLLVYVSASYLDPETGRVLPRRLNVRAGAGENFSVLGRLSQGEKVEVVQVRGEWTAIRCPRSAHGYVSKAFLQLKEPVEDGGIPAPPAEDPISLIPPPESSAPTPVPLNEITEIAREELTDVQVTENSYRAPAPEIIPIEPDSDPGWQPRESTPVVVPAKTAPVKSGISDPEPVMVWEGDLLIEPRKDLAPPANTELVKRVVRREGIVGSAVSIQSPTYFVLKNVTNGKTMNYIKSSIRNVDLKDYRGRRLVVTGEELVDSRWPSVPVLMIQNIEALK